jgi:UDPglucose 6-dehydrogenase
VASLAVVGLGPVGLTTAVAFAAQRNQVFAFDIDSSRRKEILGGKPPFHEKGLEAALRKVLREKRLSVVHTMSEALRSSNIVFLCVGTPSKPDGRMDEGPLGESVKSLAAAWQDAKRRLVVVKSTVIPGTTDTVVRPILEGAKLPFRLAVNPEFLQEGRALEGAMAPDRIVLGIDGPATGRILRALYRSVKCPVLVTDLRTAEAVKYATNAFLATKVSFANELANLCQALGVSYDEVRDGMGLDPRINPRFLVPGVGFGGSCFPKDVRALVAAGRQRGTPAPLLEAVLAQNDVQYRRAIDLLEEELGDLRGKRIALLGLAFKGDTDDVRETRAVPIARTLLSKGAVVVGYDPLAGDAFSRLMPEVKIVGSVREALEGANGVVLQADWPAFSRLAAKDFLAAMDTPVVVDGRRILDPKKMRGVRFRRIG